jgi:hypothetical protein
MPSDLEQNLIEGGLSPSAAKLISNAIDNAATARLSTGRNLADATPAEKMRLITADSRRYVFTSLDQPSGAPFSERMRSAAGTYSPRDTTHPYQNSQPASPAPTLDTASVAAGKYISVAPAKTNDVAQSKVALNVRSFNGSHARLNDATGVVEGVPILVEVEPKDSIEASVEERADATVIRIRLKK